METEKLKSDIKQWGIDFDILRRRLQETERQLELADNKIDELEHRLDAAATLVAMLKGQEI